MPINDEARDVARDALEAGRAEVVRRLDELGLPTSIVGQRLLVIDNEDLTGWRSEWERVRRSSLTVLEVIEQVNDGSVEFRAIGLREQLQAFARMLASATPLGTYAPRGCPRHEDRSENALIA